MDIKNQDNAKERVNSIAYVYKEKKKKKKANKYNQSEFLLARVFLSSKLIPLCIHAACGCCC